MKLLMKDIEIDQNLDEQAMSDISGGYTPNPDGPYPPRPFPFPPRPFPWPYQNGLQLVEKVRPVLNKHVLKLNLKRRRLSRRLRRR